VASAARRENGAMIFGYKVADPERYGVAEIDSSGRLIGLEEKPREPRSNWAVIGLYFYDNQVLDIASNLVPSARGEFEITDVNREYLRRGQLRIELLGRGMAWLDTGTHEAMLDASHFIHVIEKRQGLKIACVEEIAFRLGLIDEGQLERLAAPLRQTPYGAYLSRLLSEKPRSKGTRPP
jgi:glucose-1-phosphate thymidylyltransferase